MPSASVFYESGTGRERVRLDGDGRLVGAGAPIRGRAWSCKLTARGVSSQTRAVVPATLDVRYLASEAADRFAELADRDMAAGTPGTIECGGWRRPCLVTAEEVRNVFRMGHASAVDVVLLGGVWRRSRRVQFRPSAGAGDGAALDLPHDLPYDLAPLPAAPSAVEMRGVLGGHVGLVVYGPATDPYVRIGANVYKVSCSVPAGGHLTVDPVSEPKRVYVTDPAGNVSDVFDRAELGDGEGSGAYAFERLAQGFHPVAWAGSFGFDLILYEESGWLPWTSC